MTTDKILTQEEMDALMEDGGPATTQAAGTAEDVLPYELFSQENAVSHITPALDNIHERLAHRLQVTLTELLQHEISVVAKAVEARSYSDFIASLKPPCSLNVIDIAPLTGPGLLVFQQQLVFVLVDVFFGGKGCPSGLPADRDFTPIENRLIQRLREQVLRSIEVAWQPFVTVKCTHGAVESKPQFVTAIDHTAVLALASFEITINEVVDTFYLALPCAMFEPVRADLLASDHTEQPSPGAQPNRLLEEGVKHSQITVRGLLAETELSLWELLSIKVGDFIPIDIPSHAVLEAEGVPLCTGHYGVAQGQRALKIEQILLTNPTAESLSQ